MNHMNHKFIFPVLPHYYNIGITILVLPVSVMVFLDGGEGNHMRVIHMPDNLFDEILVEIRALDRLHKKKKRRSE